MMHHSNAVIGYLNILTLLSSIPIMGTALWLARNSATTCNKSSIEMPLLIIGFIVLIVSLFGFIGACFYVSWALWTYLFIMLLLLASLLGLAAFGFAVTAVRGGGGGAQVPGRVYMEYRLDGYSAWLKSRIGKDWNWQAARACVIGSRTCQQLAAWTPLDYLQRDLTPIQSGCCKPPTSCTYGNGIPMATAVEAQDEDCYRWNNDANVLCYGCDSCKAGVLEQVRRDLHKLSVITVAVLVFLVALYWIGCRAYGNAKRYESDYPYGRNRVSKFRLPWEHYWQRRSRGGR